MIETCPIVAGISLVTCQDACGSRAGATIAALESRSAREEAFAMQATLRKDGDRG
jgi:hypothetical protein